MPASPARIGVEPDHGGEVALREPLTRNKDDAGGFPAVTAKPRQDRPA